MLRSFRDEDTGAIWHRQQSRRLDGPAGYDLEAEKDRLGAAPDDIRRSMPRADQVGEYETKFSAARRNWRRPSMTGRGRLKVSADLAQGKLHFGSRRVAFSVG